MRLDLLRHPDRANSVRKHGVIYVKRKAGQLPYSQSPKVLAALLAQSNDGLSAQGPGAGSKTGSVEDEEPPSGFGGGVRLASTLPSCIVAVRVCPSCTLHDFDLLVPVRVCPSYCMVSTYLCPLSRPLWAWKDKLKILCTMFSRNGCGKQHEHSSMQGSVAKNMAQNNPIVQMCERVLKMPSLSCLPFLWRSLWCILTN